ncbi:cupin domain-containing protein [Maribacter sp. ACAM166]|uniref:cupin domain-containing protein n=1 Tax=Maribacter sp. ACAM166 TaxID=2508996 RepID=UPI0010FDAB02|nr:cupin domain-containing protein [Maribacter sp. ACAM166]TLP81803.1 cupin domain-containing protein [Maribacter sp. ACAM166]
MKRTKQFLSIFMLVAFTSLYLSCKNTDKKDAVSEEPSEEIATKTVSPVVLFENDYAKVVKVTLNEGEALAAHPGEERVIYSLTDYTIAWQEQDEEMGSKSWKKGDAHAHTAGQHAAKNNSTDTAEWLTFSKKDTKLPACAENTLEKDVNSVAPDVSKLLLDNDDFRITMVTLPEGEKIPIHSGSNRIIYALSDYELEYTSDTQDDLDKQFKSGDIHWHETCEHSIENIGKTEASFLVVSYKQKDE